MTYAITLRGAFNPQIFHPRWFSSEELIREEEAESASVDIIHPEFTRVQGEWFQLQVTSDQFSIATEQRRAAVWIRDLCVGAFDLLRHSPVRAVGVNRLSHYAMPDEESWTGLLTKFAPLHAWRDVLPSHPEIETVTVKSSRDGNYDGSFRIRLEPSVRVTPYGIFLDSNDHYKIAQGDSEGSTESSMQALRILRDEWENAQQRADGAINRIVSGVTAE